MNLEQFAAKRSDSDDLLVDVPAVRGFGDSIARRSQHHPDLKMIVLKLGARTAEMD